MKIMRLLAGTLALALAAPALADDPGVFKIPGTDSTIKFYGYVQLDTTLDLSGRPNDYEGNDWATDLPGIAPDKCPAGASAAACSDIYLQKQKSPQLYMTARTSRFGLTTSTPSDWGPVTVKLEGDFNAPNHYQGETYTNSVIFRLRQAYGQIGGFLVGQTWSTFLDLGAYPDNVDFNGPGTIALVRNPMFRYTFGLADGMTLALAAENAPASREGGPNFQTIPNVVAAFNYAGGWGHVNLRGVTQTYNRAITDSAGNYTDTTAKNVTVVGFAASGDVKVAGDTLVWQFAGGPGIGRYMYNANNTPFWMFNAAGDMKPITMYGVHAGYTHVWNKTVRSNLIAAYSWFTDPKIDGVPADDSMQKDFTQVFVNSFWTFSKTAELGLEYAWGQWNSFTGNNTPKLTGTENRVNATLHYNFY